MPILGSNTNVEINIKVNSDTKGVDEAKQKVEGFGGSLKTVGEIAAGIGLARLGEEFLRFSTQVSEFAINTAADFEQWKISFDTMLGDSTQASKLLKQISDFAVKTPFDLPQVIEGSKRLLAYNIEAEKIIPTFKMLGDIAAGVGTEKLPQLILAYGQVRAATKLTGAELRQFTEAGVPLLQALVDKANEHGGVMTKVGGLSKQQAKEMSSLTGKIVDQEFRMKLLTEANKNQGTSWQMLQHNYDKNKAKLAEFGAVGEASYIKVKATAADMIAQISDGNVKFEDVEKALQGMTSRGGKFFDLTAKQADTFNGTLSNLRDNMVRITAEVMGVEMTDEGSFGEIKKGSIFDQLTTAAKEFLAWVDAHKEQLIAFFRALGAIILFVIGIIGTMAVWLGVLFDWLVKIESNSGLVSSAFIALGVVITASLVPAFILAIGTIAAMIIASLPLILTVGALSVGIMLLRDAWETNWGGIRDITEAVINFIIGKINTLIDRLNFYIQVWNKVVDLAGKADWKIGEISHLGAVDINTSIKPSTISQMSSSPLTVPNAYASIPANKSVQIYQTNQISSPIDMMSLNRDLGFQLSK